MLQLVCTLAVCAASLLTEPTSRPDPLRTQTVIDANLQHAWHAWTTSAGLESWLAGSAEVELRPGGRYATNADGRVGQPGTIELKILAFDPPYMLAYTTTVPPDEFPTVAAAADTWAVVTFRRLDDTHTLVLHSALGWGEGEEWKRAREFLAHANRRVLDMLRRHFQSQSGELEPKVERVGSFSRTFETPAPPEVVWEALTTPRGLASWLGDEPAVELAFNGTITHPSRPGSEPIVERILAFDPDRMLATRLDLPPALEPNLGLVEQTWTVTRLEPLEAGGTRVTRTMLGWESGREWDAAARFFETQTTQQMKALSRMLGGDAEVREGEPGLFRPDAKAQAGQLVLDRLGVLVGEWTSKVTPPTGGPIEVRARFLRGPDGRSIVSSSDFVLPTGPAPHTAALTWLEPGTNEVRFVSLDQASQVARGSVSLQGDTLVWDWRVSNESGEQRLDVRITLIDDNRYRMVVREPDARHPLVDAEFVRDSDSTGD
ncbi:MAG: SRPBCC domain-containing protein [Leptolyngbya sp. PLA3]|nr:MAG: SRPBCC domain-containing protein [Cyanobacteria bacterium CYA]MCE7969485.1 SRPBCC domain-containing protein [Leptolyngbya sp. PL-A3]